MQLAVANCFSFHSTKTLCIIFKLYEYESILCTHIGEIIFRTYCNILKTSSLFTAIHVAAFGLRQVAHVYVLIT